MSKKSWISVLSMFFVLGLMLCSSCQPPKGGYNADVDVDVDDDAPIEITMSEEVVKAFWEKATELTTCLINDETYKADASNTDVYNKSAKEIGFADYITYTNAGQEWDNDKFGEYTAKYGMKHTQDIQKVIMDKGMAE